MVISATATATMPAATSSTSTMLPPRRADSWAAKGSGGGWLSVSAVIGKEARAFGMEVTRFGLRAPPECLNRARKRKSIRRLIDS